jgi:nucleoside-diphosphate-sugar epimerase
MHQNKVLITGATGFVGSRLCEVMELTATFRPRALVHSTGSAARISRFPIDLAIGDVCDPRSVDEAMKGCDLVVHLARGSNQVLTQGLENILRAAHKHEVRRLVHLSSVAVYGDRPTPDSRSEEARPHPGDNVYGWDKLAQEVRILRFSRRCGLPTVILRPPNIYGPFSHFTLGLIDRLRKGILPIVDGGRNPCNLVYVDNLVQAILLALTKPEALHEVFFVTDSMEITWEQCLEGHAALLGLGVPRVIAADLATPSRGHWLLDSLRATPGVLVSGDLRTVLRQIPMIQTAEKLLWDRFDSLPAHSKERLRLRLQGPRVIPKAGSRAGRFSTSDNMILAQGRTVAHSSEKARRLIGYTAPVSYQEGMTHTEAWLRYVRLIP